MTAAATQSLPPDSAAPAGQPSMTVIEPRRGIAMGELTALWRYRELWWTLALRDVRVRYKQTLLGAAWAVLQPLAMMTVASLVMGRLLGLSQRVEGSYAVFVFAGLVPWTLFSASVAAAANSVVTNGELLKKVYFPRMIVPLSAVGAPTLDAALSLGVLIGLAAITGGALSMKLLLLPALLASVLLAALGVGVLLAALTASYRDFRLVIPLMLQVWMFVTPVLYPLPVSAEWAWVLALNPMHGTIEAFRAAVLDQPIHLAAWAMSVAVASVGMVGGVAYFGRVERRFTDVV